MQPFTQRRAQSVASLGESRLIEAIKIWLGDTNPRAPYGIGDDCAVLPPSKTNQVITVDPVIYGRHFDATVSPRDVGAKLLKRNLSDLAAMGAKPTAAVVALALDASVRRDWLEQFYRGLAACARTYRVPVVGGDVAQAPGALTASLTLLGAATGPRLITRKGANIGDFIFVTGELGGSLLGHHYRFTPRLTEGEWLAQRPEIRSMMDLSDGLAKDIHALTPAGAQPDFDATAIPLSRAAHRAARASGKTPLEHAFTDGEDYELVFTLHKHADCERFVRAWAKKFRTRIRCVGTFSKAGKKNPESVALSTLKGYEHLR